MFTKVFIAWKKDYGKAIALKACSILRNLGVDYVFDEPKNCDLAIVVGGDGSLLKFQSFLQCPILGINPGGSVGFYMSANKEDFENKVKRVLLGREGKDFFIVKFMRLETKVNGVKIPYLGMNDVLISPIYVRRILDSELRVKGRKSLERNSGILVYTPGGSHAYAHSAGARILRDRDKFGVVAIAPYQGSLKRGEIILSKGNVIVKCLNEEGEVCVDGQESQVVKLGRGDIVSVKKSNSPVRIIAFEKNFPGHLHRKT